MLFRSELLQQVPVRAWASDLAPTLDYQEAVHDELAPTELKPGYYFLLYSLNESFTPNENQLGACELWVTKLGLILRNRMGTQPETNNDPPRLQGIVVDNQTGAPIAGASVQSFIREQRSQRLTPGPTVTSNIDGFFRIPSQNSNTLIFVTHEGQSFASTQETYPFGYKETWDSPILGTLFTDRSIYRPGQTIHFKGILTKNDQKLARYEVAAGIRVKIELQDINGEVVETLESMSNDYGSFSGSFTAPRNRGTGQMEIKEIGRAHV